LTLGLGNRRSEVFFARLFYMHLVSGECRLALASYRLYLAWLKRCAGQADEVRSGKTQVTNCLINANDAAVCDQ
jgi:hypothetical protein